MNAKGKKKNKEFMEGRKNVVTVELNDDLRDKIDQVKKVVRNRSKNDIALVLQSCEHLDNAVDSAIAKLIGPDKGQECLKEWEVKTRKGKQKQGDIKFSKFRSESGKSNPRPNVTALTKTKMEEEIKETTTTSVLNVPTTIIQDVVPSKSETLSPLLMELPPLSVPVTESISPQHSLDLNPSSQVESTEPHCSYSTETRHPPLFPIIESVAQPSQTPHNSPSPVESPTRALADQPNAEPAATPKKEESTRESKPKQKRSQKKPRPPKKIREKLKMMAAAGIDNNEDSLKQIMMLKESTINYEKKPEASSSTKHESVSLTEEVETITEVGDSNTSPESGISTGSASPTSSPTLQCTETVITTSPINVPDTPTVSPKPLRSLACQIPDLSGSSGCPEPSLRKLIKDLHRCDISLTRYQQILQEQCDLSARNLQRIFTMLRIGINARQEDLNRELEAVRQSASLLLQRRKATAITLRKLSESANQLEENQIGELKRQLKYFISDRKVDEAIGSINRFYGDPDDVLPSIMKFGKVVANQETYNSWNENPQEAIEKCAIKVHLASPPALLLPQPTPLYPPQCYPIFVPPFFPTQTMGLPQIAAPLMPVISEISYNSQPIQMKTPILPTPYPLTITTLPNAVLHNNSVPFIKDEFYYRPKYSPEHLAVIQERVRESLHNQGVCLYDPFTGKAIRPTSQPPNHGNNQHLEVKKKTPTQQRRERKRRQRERERKQKVNNERTQNKSNEQEDVPSLIISNENKEPNSNKVGRPISSKKKSPRPPPPWFNRYKRTNRQGCQSDTKNTTRTERPTQEQNIQSDELPSTPPNEEPPIITPPNEEPPIITPPNEEPLIITPLNEESPIITPPNKEPPIITSPNEEPLIAASIEEPSIATIIDKDPESLISTSKEESITATSNKESPIATSTSEESSVVSSISEEPLFTSTGDMEPWIATSSNEELPIIISPNEKSPIAATTEEPPIASTTEEPPITTMIDKEPLITTSNEKSPIVTSNKESPIVSSVDCKTSLLNDEPLVTTSSNEEPLIAATSQIDTLTASVDEKPLVSNSPTN